MGKQLQRTIIVTIVETWTLIWADQEGQTDHRLVDDHLVDYVLVSPSGWRQTHVAETVSVSSSVITFLSESITSEQGVLETHLTQRSMKLQR